MAKSVMVGFTRKASRGLNPELASRKLPAPSRTVVASSSVRLYYRIPDAIFYDHFVVVFFNPICIRKKLMGLNGPKVVAAVTILDAVSLRLCCVALCGATVTLRAACL